MCPVGECRPATDAPSARAALHQVLDAVVVTAPDQAAVLDRMRAFARDHDDALLRSCAEGHFTGSALVVDGSRSAVLVLFHRKLQKWLQPGGHADGEGDLAAVALREATEETGIDGLVVLRPAVDLDIHEVRPRGEARHLHLDVRFVVRAPAGAEPTGNHESEALRWVAVDELEGLGADEGLRRLAHSGTTRLSRDPGAWRTPPCG